MIPHQNLYTAATLVLFSHRHLSELLVWLLNYQTVNCSFVPSAFSWTMFSFTKNKCRSFCPCFPKNLCLHSCITHFTVFFLCISNLWSTFCFILLEPGLWNTKINSCHWTFLFMTVLQIIFWENMHQTFYSAVIAHFVYC